jgi:serine/threonine-protein kinase
MDFGMRLGQYCINGHLRGEVSPEVKTGRLPAGLYFARSDLGRDAVVRVLPRFSDPEEMERILSTARTALVLNHPNIVTTYEVGAASGERFVAMEYVDGESLDRKRWAKLYPLSAANIITIAIQVADALVYAHGCGILHRDIRPSNIMVTSNGHVKVLNFLLGRELTEDVIEWVDWTEFYVIQMTSYLSLDRIMHGDEDSRSDLFSLGVVLYEMATARLPFFDVSQEAAFRRKLLEEPEAVTRLNAKVPPELERVIHRCLEKDWGRRYQSAQDLALDLKALLSEPH